MTFQELLDNIAPHIAAYEQSSGDIVSCRISNIVSLNKGDVMWWTGNGFYQGRLDRITDEQYKLLKKGVPL